MIENKPPQQKETKPEEEPWSIVSCPGYLGSRKARMVAFWNQTYGEGNWRLSWQTADGRSLSFEDLFGVYVEGYADYFRVHPDEALFLTENFSYGYDKTLVSKEEAFDPLALYEKPGFSNQFHHAALNIALERELRLPFKGEKPIQVRGAKPGTPVYAWPKGWQWHPGRIPCPNPELIPANVTFERRWWKDGSIEDLYQRAKILEVKSVVLERIQNEG